ncbi:cellulase family glycosylhydrolase [Fibrobacter sp.]|uniref:cellulase family glycosylhydrolase n=1 Tax=Fibrobacter sp. TaxID=35828 RepID=UPI0038698FAA
MQIKNFYPKMSVLGIATVMALTACGDDNAQALFANNPTPGAENQVPVSSSDMNPTSSDAVVDPTSSSVAVVDPSTLPAEGPITMPAGLGTLVDDFEDGDNLSKIGDYWYTYNDNDNGGASIITTPLNEEENIIPGRVNNGSNYALQVNYTLDRGEYAYDPYVGWGVQVAPDEANGHFGGLTYWYKGGAHEVHVEITDVEDYDVHLAKFPASRTWKQAVVRFKDLVQGGWGKEVPFDAKHIMAISFQAKGNKNKVVTDSLFIDNIYLQDSSEVEKDQPDMEIMDPVIPVVEFTEAEITVTNPLQEKAMKYLNKGVNFTNWLENADGKFKSFELGESDVKILADNGFKSLRLPIDLDLYATNRDAFIAGTDTELTFDDDTLFLVLDSFVEWTAKYNMSLVIDYHEYDNSYNTTSAKDANYVKMMAEVWKHVAAHYAENPREDLFFELLNEPDMTNGKVTAATWTTAAQAMIDAIRTVDTKHTILFGDAQWYSITLLAKRTPFTDDNIIYVIHTYEPFAFTHQGGSWTDYATIHDIPFPYDPAKWSTVSGDFGVNKSTKSYVKTNIKNYYKTGSKEAILEQILKAKKWAATNNVPVIINEFGALNLRSTAESRINYLTAMREICDTLQIPWTHWGYTGNFSVIENGKLIEGLDKALGVGSK